MLNLLSDLKQKVYQFYDTQKRQVVALILNNTHVATLYMKQIDNSTDAATFSWADCKIQLQLPMQ